MKNLSFQTNSKLFLLLVCALCLMELVEGFSSSKRLVLQVQQQPYSSPWTTPTRSTTTTAFTTKNENDGGEHYNDGLLTEISNTNIHDNNGDDNNNNRRTVLQGGITTAMMMMTSSSSSITPLPAFAATESTSIVDPKEVLKRLRPVPTFAIVDPKGVPYMIVESDNGGGRGYFFTTLSGAVDVLQDAQRAAQEAGYPETWEGATIMTVPLDVAMRLAVGTKKRKSQAAIVLDSISDVIASVEGIEDASKYDKSQRYSQKGRVPLFVSKDVTLQLNDGTSKTPAYFRVNDLLEEWNAQHPNNSNNAAGPKIQVLDLLETFTDMVKPGGKNQNVKDIIFIPNKEVVQVAKELNAKQMTAGEDGGRMIYQVNDMVLVSGKKS